MIQIHSPHRKNKNMVRDQWEVSNLLFPSPTPNSKMRHLLLSFFGWLFLTGIFFSSWLFLFDTLIYEIHPSLSLCEYFWRTAWTCSLSFFYIYLLQWAIHLYMFDMCLLVLASRSGLSLTGDLFVANVTIHHNNSNNVTKWGYKSYVVLWQSVESKYCWISFKSINELIVH